MVGLHYMGGGYGGHACCACSQVGVLVRQHQTIPDEEVFVCLMEYCMRFLHEQEFV